VKSVVDFGTEPLTWPSQNQTEINHEEHEGHEVFYALFFMVLLSFMVEYFVPKIKTLLE